MLYCLRFYSQEGASETALFRLLLLCLGHCSLPLSFAPDGIDLWFLLPVPFYSRGLGNIAERLGTGRLAGGLKCIFPKGTCTLRNLQSLRKIWEWICGQIFPLSRVAMPIYFYFSLFRSFTLKTDLVIMLSLFLLNDFLEWGFRHYEHSCIVLFFCLSLSSFLSVRNTMCTLLPASPLF